MKLKKFVRSAVSLATAAVIAASSIPAFAYHNSVPVGDQWASTSGQHYGLGDPFVMKYNGMYYLYVTTPANQKGINVWSSEDMVNWTFEGNCVDKEDSESWDTSPGIYAPEVKYWNGTFYLYCSSDKQFHRTLTSDSPTGPFVIRNDTGASGIDGSVYIDDDEAATKYFLRSGIEYYRLNDDMLTVSGSSTGIPGATVTRNWTEGASIFRRNGKYYMTYTGNHCKADAYMIEYAIGDTPTDMKEPVENRILINTEEGIVGLGHNSTVIGPDLDSRYIVYHNLLSTNVTEREMNIDRIVFNGEKLEVQGPTWWETDDPRMPDFYDRMENADNWETVSGTVSAADGSMTLGGEAAVLSKQSTPDDYTAEFNMRIGGWDETAGAGVLVSYTDEDNYAYAYITPQTNMLHLKTVVNKTETEKTAKLPDEYTYTGTELINITVKKQGGVFDVYADERLLITSEAELGGGKIGYSQSGCTLKASYTAFSSAVNGSEDASSVKPTGSAMDAVHANEKSRDFETGTLTETNTNPDVSGRGAEITSSYIKDMTEGDSISFEIAAQESANYSADFKAKSSAGAKVNIEVDGDVVAQDFEIPASDNFAMTACRDVKINNDSEKIKITVTQGTLDLYSVKLAKLDDIHDAEITQDEMNFEILEGIWEETEDTMAVKNNTVWSKAVYGTEYMGDYELSSDITLKSGTDAGLLVRLKYATTASDKNSGIGNCQTSDYHQGYYVYLNTEGVHLGKQVFNWKALYHHNTPLSLNKSYNIKVRAQGANIKVWLDGALVIDYTDTDQPLMEGKVGMRAFNAFADYKNLTLTHIDPADPVSDPPELSEGAVALTKTSVNIYSDAVGKGYKLVNGGIEFRDSRRSVKGYLNNAQVIDGTVSCDINIPRIGYFSAGLILRAKASAFADRVDSIDGIAVQLERGGNSDAVLNVYHWQNRAYKGTLAKKTIENYFADNTDKTAHLEVDLTGNTLTAYLDGDEQLTADISAYPGGASRDSIGFRSHTSTKITITNFTYKNAEKIVTDRTKLNAEIESANAINKELYTPDSVLAFNEVLEAAKTAASDEQATQEQINDALSALVNAVKRLVGRADFTALNSAIKQAESINSADYTADSIKTLSEALAAARETAANGNASQAAVDNAAAVLKNALNALVKNVPIPDNNKDNAVVSGVKAINGKTVLYSNGKAVTGTRTATVGGKTYAVVKGYVSTGRRTHTVKIGSRTYVVNKYGIVQKGRKNKLVKVSSSKWYIVNKSGVVQKGKKNKLVRVGTKSYIVNKNGIVQKGRKNKLVKIGKKSYIVNKSGIVQKNKKSIKAGRKTYKTNKKGIAKLKK